MTSASQPDRTPTPPMVPLPAQQAGETTYLGDPRLDRLLGVITELAAELWVMRDRQRALEAILDQRGIPVETELAAYRPTADRERQLKEERDAFVRRVFRELAE